MIDRFDEAELLAYIEDEMSAEEARALESRLRDEPHVGEAIDRMREDRALLRSSGQPVPRIDFVAELEPQLARPMLMEPRPGSYRRQRHRRLRVARLRRSAAAAAVLLIVVGGLWMALAATGFSPRGWIERQMARGGASTTTADDPAATADPAVTTADAGQRGAEPWPPPGEVVHHWGPLPSVVSATDHALAMRRRAAEGRGTDAIAPVFHSASFAIVLRGDDETVTQWVREGLSRLAGSDAGGPQEPVALVRNFSFDEARAMIEQYLVDAPAGSVPEPVRAALDSDSPTVSVRDRMRVRRSLASGLRAARAIDADETQTRWSRRLIGPEALAPDYERQLDFSSRGAELTASVPVAQLEELLGALFDEAGGAMTMRSLADDTNGRDETAPGDQTGTALQRWLRDLASIRDEIARLRHADPDAQLLLPVVIEPSDP
jgi:hypothetical protein